MTRVVLRDEACGEERPLGEVPLESVDRIIPTIKHWGMARQDGSFVDLDTLCGTFLFGEDGAYFQVGFE